MTLSFSPQQLSLRVVDEGSGIPETSATDLGSGHGLAGMRERADRHGGIVRAQPRPEGGFEVVAELPIPTRNSALGLVGRLWMSRWFDLWVAGAWLIALEIETFTGPHRHGPLALNVITVAVMALSACFLRRRPFSYLVLVGIGALVLSSGLTSRNYATLTGAYSVLVPCYAVASWLPTSRAVAGLAIYAIAVVTTGLANGRNLGGVVGPLLLAAVAAAAGGIVRSQRELEADLRRTSDQLLKERNQRAGFIVTAERARAAGRLHIPVAKGVTLMVILAETVQTLITSRDRTAHDARIVDSIAAIEDTGREVLTQMRNILGVLHHEPAPRSPLLEEALT